ncbi:hypothetical protein S245_050448 [Arachis hypogaea]
MSKQPFKFDRVYTPKDDQVDVFADASSMVTSVLDGYNVCIFAYGQTGTGKTFTMEGTELNRGVEQELGLEIKQASKGSHQLKLKTLRRPGMYCKLEAKVEQWEVIMLISIVVDLTGSDAKTLMFVQISPSDKDLDKTLSALNFATRVRGVVLGSVKMQVDTGELQKTKVMKFKVKEETYRKREEKYSVSSGSRSSREKVKEHVKSSTLLRQQELKIDTFTSRLFRVRGVVLGSVKMQVDTSELRKTKAMLEEL